MDTNIPTTTAKTNFHISAIIADAWRDIAGAKKQIWGAVGLVFLITFGIALAIAAVNSLAATIGGESAHIIAEIINFILQGCVAAFYVGVFILAIYRVRHQATTVSTVFIHLKRFWGTFFTWVIQMVIVFICYFIGAFVFILLLMGTGNLDVMQAAFSQQQSVQIFIQENPQFATLGITYLAAFLVIMALILSFFRYSLPAVFDQGLSPFAAIGRSIKMAAKHWFRNFILMFVVNLVLGLVIVLPTIAGTIVTGMMHTHWWLAAGVTVSVVLLVWLLPYFYFLYGHAYHRLLRIYQENHNLSA